MHIGRTGHRGALAQGLLQTGQAVLVVAPFLTGGAAREGHDEADPLYHTYNQATMACRVQDILTGLAYLDQHLRVGKRHLVGQGEAGVWCLFARGVGRWRRQHRGGLGWSRSGRRPSVERSTFRAGDSRLGRYADGLGVVRPGAAVGTWGRGVISHSASLGDAMVRRVWEHGSWLREGRLGADRIVEWIN